MHLFYNLIAQLACDENICKENHKNHKVLKHMAVNFDELTSTMAQVALSIRMMRLILRLLSSSRNLA